MAVFGDGSPLDKEATERKCSFCGGQSVAYWHGFETVEVCCKCAEQDLPRLMADAIVQDKSTNFGAGVQAQRIERFWQKVEKVFYKAAMYSALRGAAIKEAPQEKGDHHG